MSIGFQHPNVGVYIGDGFEFLKNRKNEFDVIITDSSDPEGPAESLFQKPYFELLRDALRDGGVITTQGCSLFFFPPVSFIFTCPSLCPLFLSLPSISLSLSPVPSNRHRHRHNIRPQRIREKLTSLKTPNRHSPPPGIARSRCCFNPIIAENQWLHLSLIANLRTACKEVFPVAEYAYTTIPTYPSGQIGFMVCCKDAERNVREPLRQWSREEEERLCRYYNADVHRAAFVLPNFARKALN